MQNANAIREIRALPGLRAIAQPFSVRIARPVMVFALLISDSFALLVAGAGGILLRALLDLSTMRSIVPLASYLSEGYQAKEHWILFPWLFAFIMAYAWRGLYPCVGVGPVEEMRRLSITTTMVMLLLVSLTFFLKMPQRFSRLVLASTWAFALPLVPVGRVLARKLLARANLWGEGAAILGVSDLARQVTQFLIANPTLGLRPCVAVKGHTELPSESGEGFPIPIISSEQISEMERAGGIRIGILVEEEWNSELLRKMVEIENAPFERYIVIRNAHQLGTLWVRALDLGGMHAVEIRQNLLNRWEQGIKRVIDILLVVVAAPVIIPLIVFLGLMVLVDSGWPVFFAHMRVGRRGFSFPVWKFRTMYRDADQILEKHLRENPEAKREWERDQKLKYDPRVTRVGQFLRKFSLDELPQVWNVLRGEMSLVGPRPITKEESVRYGSCFKLYQRVSPGITGLWQVSGRNEVGYDQRVRLDEYYVLNWSIWLDIYILAKTPWVVLTKRGAY
jgi:Undecaprenyl-phosphate galactose phosphotransferase WbaP